MARIPLLLQRGADLCLQPLDSEVEIDAPVDLGFLGSPGAQHGNLAHNPCVLVERLPPDCRLGTTLSESIASRQVCGGERFQAVHPAPIEHMQIGIELIREAEAGEKGRVVLCRPGTEFGGYDRSVDDHGGGIGQPL